MNRRKSYKNVIVLGVIAVAAASYLLYRSVNVNEALWKAGYYDNKIAVLNTADVLGHIVYYERAGDDLALDSSSTEMGAALIKGLADEVRAANPHSLFFDSGDFFAGTSEANVNRSEGTVETANLMGYDGMTLGQHDFSWGFERTKEIESQVRFPILAANVSNDGKPAFERYVIYTVDGLKIGVFGLTSDQFLQGVAMRESPNVRYEDPIETARSVVAELRSQEVNAIILLSHIGDDYDREQIVPQVDGIDLILSGRGFKLYKKAVKINDTYVAEAGAFGSHLGVASMYFRDGRVAKVDWNILRSADQSKADKAVAETTERYHRLALAEGQEVLAVTASGLDGIRSHVRTRETNFTNVIADAMRDEGQADLAIFNAGVIRESVPPGEVNLYKLERALPFYNSLVTVEIRGETIYEAIENGLNTWPNGVHNGGFPQVSGIRYVIDGSQPAGKRLNGVSMNGQPLDRGATFKVAITDYLLTGGDNYGMFEDAKVLSRGGLLKDVVGRYVKKLGTLPEEAEGRIAVVNQRYK
ncbi:bifunctional metallophosphatase/5'-nucleotidase [Paenibacillaceae bacterium WGS1546]|uniref:bifunctional metallophosphatase/5'-nucleotidase n=1 Tax=Cohnella sp. WGS1546 TaxID=3366810 RepID=UPI00372D33FA